MNCHTVDCRKERVDGEPYCEQCLRIIILLGDARHWLGTFVEEGYRGLRRRQQRSGKVLV